MLKKTVNFEDFDGNLVEETHYFNFNTTELIDIAIELPAEMTDVFGEDPSKVDPEAAGMALLRKMGGTGIVKFIKDIVLRSYGVKSEDGRKFIKDEQLTKEFSQSLAYDAIITEFMSDDVAAAEFINKVIPANVLEKMTTNMKGNAQLPVNN